MRALALFCAFAFGCAGDPSQSPEDAGATDGAVVADLAAALPSPCARTGDRLDCPHQSIVLVYGPNGFLTRTVHFAIPSGTPPSGGFPVAILFQGSFYSAARTWSAVPADPFGAIYQTELVEALLTARFAVITPEAAGEGTTFWNTNVPPYSLAWDNAPDHFVMLALFDSIASGRFGPLDEARLYASGISSGGYMTSRMAVSYPGKFRALAIQSASYATCAGALCALPSTLPADHPPTAFLHGEMDQIVPISTMLPYAMALSTLGVETKIVTDPNAGHAWLSVAPATIPAWFLTHP